MGQKYMPNARFAFCVVFSISPLLRRTLTLTHGHQRDAGTVADSNVHICQPRSTAVITWTHGEVGVNTQLSLYSINHDVI